MYKAMFEQTGTKSFRFFFTPDTINRLFMLFCCGFLGGGECYKLVNTRNITINFLLFVDLHHAVILGK